MIIELGEHEYVKSEFTERIDYFEKDCEISEQLRRIHYILNEPLTVV